MKESNYIFPFLWMHGEEEQVLREYMQVIRDSNIEAVCVESRPHPDFVGDGWWKDMDIILEEAKRLNMKVWILDDSHFPTGYANGALEHEPDEMCRQSLVYQVAATIGGGKETVITLTDFEKASAWIPNMIESYQIQEENMRHFDDDRIISITAVKTNGDCFQDIIDLSMHIGQKECKVLLPEGQWKLYICHLTRNRGPHRNYINMMSKESCHKLIEAVYEPHYNHYGSEFGQTIAGFFSDEPEIGNGHLYETGKRIFELEDQPWSKELEERLQDKWGADFTRMIPLIWDTEFANEFTAKARYEFMDEVTSLVQENFSIQIGEWCRNHGVEYIGHMIEDNNQSTRTGSSLGHYFRGLAGQSMAGIDDIGGQVFPGGEWNGPYGLMGEQRDGEFYHYVLGKLASSLAAIDPLKQGRSMCEIFGNYGWEEGVHLEKYLVDHFLVRGINHFVPHAFSPKEFPDPDCPPHFYAHGHNPQYRHFGALMRYTNRMCDLISGGKHVAPVAILYNAEAEWTGDYMNLSDVAKILADHQIEYDFIPADVFADRAYYGTEVGNELVVNENSYRALIIVQSQFITKEVADAVEEMNAADGKVVFINQYPEGICDGETGKIAEIPKAEIVPLDQLMNWVNGNQLFDVNIQPENNRIRYIRYQDVFTKYIFVNEGEEPYIGEIHVPEKGMCYEYDAWDNQCYVQLKEEDTDGTKLKVSIYPGKSLVVCFEEIPEDICKRSEVSGTRIDFSNRWSRSICNAIDYPDFKEGKIVSLPDTLETEAPLFSGFVRYEKSYVRKENTQHVLLEIEKAGEAVEVFVNDISAGIQIVAPFIYNLSELTQNGENMIRIEVATTLEREMSQIPDPIRTYMGLEQKVPECATGICGGIHIYEKNII
ncbi:glycosyl hydrolase family 2 protein [Anaerobium acetethylicum]|uniref:Alpha-L-rhamnosidase n=1 Tax=Anaerobium acetethylicum TaxID=1619234 RepID=A0A1D3TX27_9FIRM|nr:glycosyl hydrolase [Anaerobium acetethylicum]SCP98834.1 alpha-L-rhamnosidase [Anaerobium acetethylicum]